MRPYQYRCHDHSLLTPWFKKWVVAPMIRITPWIIPANIITILSNLFVYLGLILAFNEDWFGFYTPLLVALCLLLYLIGDHVDGMQAKRTGTGSALGEFCDHYLDAFNNGIVVYTLCVIFDIGNPIFIAAIMVASYLAHMVVFYEQFKTGWLTFEKLGSLEAVLLAAVLIVLSMYSPLNSLLTDPLIRDFSVIGMIMLGSGLGGVLTFLSTLKRIPELKAGFWVFTLLLSVTAAASIFIFDSFQVFVVITLYASLYIGRIMKGHLVDGIERQTDFATPVILTVLAAWPLLPSDNVFWSVCLYLLIWISILIFQTFSALRQYWVWTNERS